MPQHGVLDGAARTNGSFRNGRPHSPEETAAGWKVKKREGGSVPFLCDRIRLALRKCFSAVSEGPADGAAIERIMAAVVGKLDADGNTCPHVEHVQRLVIQQLWLAGLFEQAEHYQNYREQARRVREAETAPVFVPRDSVKPFEYRSVVAFKEAMHKAPWTFKTYDPISDVQDFRVELSGREQTACARTVLAISQIEVDAKRFWANLGRRVPKTEFEQIGYVFSDSEVRHFDAYSNILDVLSLNDMFGGLTKVPAIRRRVDYINKAKSSGSKDGDRGFAKSLAMFALLIENVSLFSQFVIMRSFYEDRGIMKNIDNTVQATMKEETVHALFGAWLCNLIKHQRPEWFGPKFQDELRAVSLDAYEGERAILDWIFEEGVIGSVSRPALDEFLKDRINQGMALVGCDPLFPRIGPAIGELEWFVRELAVPTQSDFFWKEPTEYTSNDKNFSADTMWD